ncbi:hypothetical protein Poli38472_009044 [Pythium oligandrum]|uniref:Calmodulin n=1 Tax=Pythium oligandrum TaxID=41045 RepID=A0A8K1FMH7_PYTOL|nr:hypothetical protein Poli38472_009044 [Pythium oligandrum]|eukprot:TMW64877.1 hypothetical protein Poli38472_009044 [Pythium oligandrum]
MDASRASTPPPSVEDMEDGRRQKAMIAAQLGLTLEEYEALDAAFGTTPEEDDEDSMTARYHTIFSQYDVDGSGAISPEELRSLLKAAGEDMDDAELAKVIEQADTDGDGEIGFDEFMDLMRARKRLLHVAKTMGIHGTGPGMQTRKGGIKAPSHGKSKSSATSSSPSPLSSSSPLPPLKLASVQSKKHLQQFNRHFSRPTPTCLRPGAQVDMTQLRRELAIAEYGLQELNSKVREDVHWVQQNCPVRSLKAQIYCHRWGMEKVQQLFSRLQSQTISRAYQKWKAFLMYERNKLKANLFLKCKGSQKMTEIMNKWKRKTLRRRFTKWKIECEIEARNEVQSAAIEIQRVMRGKLARLWRWREKRRLAATTIQALVRGHLARCTCARMRRDKLEHEAACILQRCYRGYNGKRVAKALFKVQRETLAARRVQRGFRNHQRRVLLRTIQRAKLEHDSAIQLQCCMRSYLARKERRRRILHQQRVQSSIVIQRHTRGLLARRLVNEKKRRLTAALTIQTRYRAYRSRWEVYHMRLNKAQREQRQLEYAAAIRIQTKWRSTHARQQYIQKKTQLREAQKLLAFRRLASALRIQCLFRGYRARRQAQRLRYEKLKWMNFTVMNRSALKIQAFWRGYHGRLASQLRLQAKRALEFEEQEAARRIQSIARGKLARGELNRRQEHRQYMLTTQQKQAKAALMIQKVVRGKRARKLTSKVRQEHADQAKAALDRLIRQTKARAAIKIQCCVRRFLARMRYWKRRHEAKRKKLAEEMRLSREHAAIVIQCAMRRAKARRLLLQRRRDFERRISLMASEKAYDEIERLRQEQEAELAQLRVQFLMQQSQAEKESVKLRQQLEAQREEEAERREKEAQELAKLRLEALMQQHTQQSERKILEHQRYQDAERLRENLERQKLEHKQHEELVRTQENEELARMKMTALLQGSTSTKAHPGSHSDEEAKKLAQEAERLEKAAIAMKREQARLKIQSCCLKYIVKQRLQKLQAEQAAAIAKLHNEEERKRLKAIQEKEMALAKLKAMMDDEARAREQEIKALEAQMLERARLEKERLAKRHAAARKIQSHVRGYLGRQRVKAIQRKIEHEREERAKVMEAQLAAAEAKMVEALSATGGSTGSNEVAGSGEAASASNPEDWVEYWDDNAQASYFYNIKTQEASWTRPFSAPAADTVSASEQDPNAYEAYSSDVSGYANGAVGAQGYADEYGFYDQYGQYHYYEEQNATYQNPAMQGMASMYPGYAAAAAAYAYHAAMAFGAPMMYGGAMGYGGQMMNPQLVNPMMMTMNTATAMGPNTNPAIPSAATPEATTDTDAPPDPWEKFFDQYTGAAYYYNNITGERYWA